MIQFVNFLGKSLNVSESWIVIPSYLLGSLRAERSCVCEGA